MTIRLKFGMWQAEEQARLIGDILEFDQATGFADHVEQVAMLASGSVSLMFN